MELFQKLSFRIHITAEKLIFFAKKFLAFLYNCILGESIAWNMMLSIAELSFPLKDPVLLFSLILFIILFAPILLNKLKIPHLIGLIIAGAIIGPNGFHIMDRDSSIVLFGTVGLLYILFMAGLEIDIVQFKKNSGKSIYFGLMIFILSVGLGFLGAYYLLDYKSLTYYPVETSILLASIFGSHTPIVYPMISKMGIAKNRVVNITIGGTLFTDILAFLVLAFIVAITSPEFGGEIPSEFWWRLSIYIILFGLFVMLVFPIIGRWFFKRFEDNISQYIFVLAMVFLGAFLAELAGIEPIIGAFLSGLALNRLIPHTSPLMNRIEFVGNALFIPFFLIGVGMLIDFKAFIKDTETLIVAVFMTAMALITRQLAAWIMQKSFGYTQDERRVMVGLSSAQAAATLAVVLVGYNIILNQEEVALAKAYGLHLEPVRLLGEPILNGSILMILITCTIASFVAQKGAKNIALKEAADTEPSDDPTYKDNILIPISSMENAEELVNLSLTIKSQKNKSGLFAMHVVSTVNGGGADEKNARKILEHAVITAAAGDTTLREVLRYDLNTINGISGVVKEHQITDIVLGLTTKSGFGDSFLGATTEGILQRNNHVTTLIYRPVQPLATIKRLLIIIPENAEKETGFANWLLKIWNFLRNTGATAVFYGSETTLSIVREVQTKNPIECTYHTFTDWNDFLILSRDIKSNDNIIVVMSRKDYISYHKNMVKIPVYLKKYFGENNFMLIYPMQGTTDNTMRNYNNPSVLQPVQDNLARLEDLGKTINNLFKRK